MSSALSAAQLIVCMCCRGDGHGTHGWMMLGVTGISIHEQLGLDSTQLGVLTATPVFTEALP